MGPEFWKPQSPTRLRKCDEFRVGSCNEPTDGCCAVVSCRYCLTFEGTYSYTGTATFSDNGWQGTIAGSTFFAYWERNVYTGECEFVVTIDGYEVYRKSCYEGQSCRDSSDSVYATIGDESGVLAWSRHTLRPLEYVIDSETGCRTWFCGNCECTCNCLCVTIFPINQSINSVCRGELCDVSYPCDAPVWEGEVVCGYDTYLMSLSLQRGSYGDCEIVPTINGEELEAVPVSGCTDLAAIINLYDGTILAVVCKVCSCEDVAPYPCECRVDADHTGIGHLVSGGSICSIDPIAFTLLSGPYGLIDISDYAWLPEWCVNHSGTSFKITAFPPYCEDTDTSRMLVFVKKTTSADGPLIDNTIAGLNDWYVVVYNIDGTGPLGIFYEYEQCCLNDTPSDAATSHLIRVKFFNVFIGDGVYDLIWTNNTSLAAYGDCT